MRKGFKCHVFGGRKGSVEAVKLRLRELNVDIVPDKSGDGPDFEISQSVDAILVVLDNNRKDPTPDKAAAVRQKLGIRVIAVCDEDNDYNVSRALALGFDDFISLSLDDVEFRRQLNACQDLTSAMRETAFRQKVVGQFVDPHQKSLPSRDEGSAKSLLVVGQTTPFHVQLAGIFGQTRLVFAPNVASIDTQLANAQFAAIIVTDQALRECDAEKFDKVRKEITSRRNGPILLLAQFDDDAGIDWHEMGFSGVLPGNSSPEFLRLRLTFWCNLFGAREEMEVVDTKNLKSPISDELSGLFNFAFAAEYLSRKIKGSEYESQGSSGLIVFRLRGLSECNRRWNCVVGNDIISATGSILRSAVRRDDVVARIHGGLFAVVASIGSRDQLGVIENRVRANLQANLPKIDDIAPPVTLISSSSICNGPGCADLDVLVQRVNDPELNRMAG